MCGHMDTFISIGINHYKSQYIYIYICVDTWCTYSYQLVINVI